MTTGFFGIPGSTGGKVHLVENGLPVCGVRLSPKAEYQHCRQHIAAEWIECERCKPIARRILERQHAERMKVLK